MRRTSRDYIDYLKREKGVSANTATSYQRDLYQMIEFFNMHGIFDYEKVNETNLNSYVLYMELKGKSNATIIRSIASIRGYFDYMFKSHLIQECITDRIERPILEKRAVNKANNNDVEMILSQASGDNPKNQRDFCILKLMCVVGLKVSEIASIEVHDINYEVGFLQFHKGNKIKTIQISTEVSELLKNYIENGRKSLVKDPNIQLLFTNVYGEKISRQGIWKMIKGYAKQAGIEDVSPTKLCNVISE